MEKQILLDGLNNGLFQQKQIIGGDDEVGFPSIQAKKSTQKNSKNEPNNENIESPKAEIENPIVKTIIKKIIDEDEGSDKVDIDFEKSFYRPEKILPPTDEYLEN